MTNNDEKAKILTFTLSDDEINKIKKSYKEDLAEFFACHGIKNIDTTTMKLNTIGKTYLLNSELSGYENEHRQNMVWTTIFQKDLDLSDDIWWVARNESKIYLFKLPKEEHFRLADFVVTQKTQGDNAKPRNNGRIGADIVLDTTDDCFHEMLGSVYNNFTEFLRAKLDLNTRKLLIYADADPVSPEEYLARRQKLSDELNPEQKDAAETDVKSSLVVAGAGCGKTKTLMGRVNYLYETNKIKSADDILLVVFNKKNRTELKQKLKYYNYDTQSAHTFHSIGYRICRDFIGQNIKSIDPDEGNPLELVLKLFESDEYNGKTTDRYYTTLSKMDLDVQRIKEETNWAYNLYKWAAENREPADIKTIKLYREFVPNNFEQCEKISHFDESNFSLDVNNYRFADNDICKLRMLNYLVLNGYSEYIVNRPEKYVQIISDALPLPNGTKLYWKNYGLENNFDKLKQHVPCNVQLTANKIDKIINAVTQRAYSYRFGQVAGLFITLCKIYQDTDFEKIEAELLKQYRDDKKCEHIRLFFELIKPVYTMYEKFLESENLVDFNDMINQATSVLNKTNDKTKFKYKYILVDEFQDISYDTFRLIKALKERYDASIMCVGDDWQAIYSWKGSDLDFFNKFAEKFELKDDEYQEFILKQTYRYGQKLADISGDFIMKNPAQKKKTLVSDSSKSTDIKVFESKDGWDALLDDITNKYGKDVSVKVLLRYNNDYNIIGKKNKDLLLSELQKHFPNNDTDVITIHKSKGLEADVIIILNLITGKFPSAIETDPVLLYFYTKYHINKDKYPNSEERRLMYVAMTRARKACYLWRPLPGKDSIFLCEIMDAMKKDTNDKDNAA